MAEAALLSAGARVAAARRRDGERAAREAQRAAAAGLRAPRSPLYAPSPPPSLQLIIKQLRLLLQPKTGSCRQSDVGLTQRGAETPQNEPEIKMKKKKKKTREGGGGSGGKGGSRRADTNRQPALELSASHVHVHVHTKTHTHSYRRTSTPRDGQRGAACADCVSRRADGGTVLGGTWHARPGGSSPSGDKRGCARTPGDDG